MNSEQLPISLLLERYLFMSHCGNDRSEFESQTMGGQTKNRKSGPRIRLSRMPRFRSQWARRRRRTKLTVRHSRVGKRRLASAGFSYTALRQAGASIQAPLRDAWVLRRCYPRLNCVARITRSLVRNNPRRCFLECVGSFGTFDVRVGRRKKAGGILLP